MGNKEWDELLKGYTRIECVVNDVHITANTRHVQIKMSTCLIGNVQQTIELNMTFTKDNWCSAKKNAAELKNHKNHTFAVSHLAQLDELVFENADHSVTATFNASKYKYGYPKDANSIDNVVTLCTETYLGFVKHVGCDYFVYGQQNDYARCRVVFRDEVRQRDTVVVMEVPGRKIKSVVHEFLAWIDDIASERIPVSTIEIKTDNVINEDIGDIEYYAVITLERGTCFRLCDIISATINDRSIVVG